MERSDWSCHILEFWTTRAQYYQTPFRVRLEGWVTRLYSDMVIRVDDGHAHKHRGSATNTSQC